MRSTIGHQKWSPLGSFHYKNKYNNRQRIVSVWVEWGVRGEGDYDIIIFMYTSYTGKHILRFVGL